MFLLNCSADLQTITCLNIPKLHVLIELMRSKEFHVSTKSFKNIFAKIKYVISDRTNLIKKPNYSVPKYF